MALRGDRAIRYIFIASQGDTDYCRLRRRIVILMIVEVWGFFLLSWYIINFMEDICELTFNPLEWFSATVLSWIVRYREAIILAVFNGCPSYSTLMT